MCVRGQCVSICVYMVCVAEVASCGKARCDVCVWQGEFGEECTQVVQLVCSALLLVVRSYFVAWYMATPLTVAIAPMLDQFMMCPPTEGLSRHIIAAAFLVPIITPCFKIVVLCALGDVTCVGDIVCVCSVRRCLRGEKVRE